MLSVLSDVFSHPLDSMTQLRRLEIRRSIALHGQEVSEIGRYEAGSSAGLPGFRSGTIIDCFHRGGTNSLIRSVLKGCLRCFLFASVRFLTWRFGRVRLLCFWFWGGISRSPLVYRIAEDVVCVCEYALVYFCFKVMGLRWYV